MMTDEDYNKDASWLFPPRPRTAGQYVAFWSKIEIPDEILTRVVKTFRRLALDEFMPHNSKIKKDFEPIWRANYPTNFAGRFLHAVSSELQAIKQVELDAYTLSRGHEFFGNRPVEIATTDARTIARASLMYSSPQQFTKVEWDWVLGYPIVLSTGTTTVQGIEETYRLWRMRSTLQTPIDTITDVLINLETLKEDVGQVRQQLDSMEIKIGTR